MSEVPVFFAFPDGVLSYDCASCDQRCCKTGSLAVFPQEREIILRGHPALELVAPSRPSGITYYSTPLSGCWFLKDSKCSLVTEHDGAMRPAGCSLFPFNIFGMLEDHLVVAPNVLCPLTVKLEGGGTSHADLAELLGVLGAAGESPQSLRVQDPPGNAVLERVLRDGAAAALADVSPIPLVAFQALVTEAFVAGEIEHADLSHMDAYVPAVEDAWFEAVDILGIEPPDGDSIARITPLVNAMSTTIRLFAFDDVPLGRLPKTFLNLCLYAAHWVHLRPEREMIPQTLAQMVGSVGDTCAALAHWDVPWRGEAEAELGLQPGAPPAETVQLPKEPMARGAALRHAGQLWRAVGP